MKKEKRCKKSSNCEIAINTPLNKKKFYSTKMVFARLHQCFMV